MDMKINHKLLRHQREQRAWTQSQLAEIAGLSMRTVQRIERNGVASKESAMALASTLNVELTSLLAHPTSSVPVANSKYRRWWGIAGIGATLLVVFGWWSTAAAEQVMISLSVKTEYGATGDMKLLNEIGVPSEVKFDRQFRLLVTASRQEQHLLLSTEVYDFVDGDYRLISTPAILVADKEQAGIHLNTQGSGLLELGFKSDF